MVAELGPQCNTERVVSIINACQQCSGGLTPTWNGQLQCPLTPAFSKCGLLALNKSRSPDQPITREEALQFIRPPATRTQPVMARPADPVTLEVPTVGIWRYNGLGDTIMATVLLRAWKERGYRTALFTQPAYSDLMQRCPDVDEVHAASEPPDTEGFSHFFDLDITGIAPDFLPESLVTERIDLLLKIGQAHLPSMERCPVLIPTEYDRNAVASLWRVWGLEKRPFTIGLCPFSESVPRSLSLEGAERLANLLAQQFPQSHLILIGDDDRIQELQGGGHVLNHAPLPLLCGVIDELDLLVTVDTSVMHLGAAVKTPTLALFSEVNPRTRCGYYPTVHPIYRPHDCPFGISPCGGDGATCHNTPCISNIPEDYWRTVLGASGMTETYLELQNIPRLPHPLKERFCDDSNQELWVNQGRVEFYHNHPRPEAELLIDRTQPTQYEYPRVEWALSQVKGRRVLDVGTAGGQITKALLRVPILRTVDACEPCQAWADNLHGIVNGRVYPMMIEELLQQPGHWDTVLLLDVLEHLADPLGVLASMVTGWKPERIVATVPLGRWEGTDEHLHEWGEVDIQGILSPFGGTYTKIKDRDGKDRWFGLLIEPPTRRRRGQ